MSSVNAGADAAGVLVRLGRVVVEEVGQEALDDPVAPDHLLRARGARGRQHELAPAAALEQALGGEPLEHLADGRARDAERLGDARRDRRRSLGRLVDADRGDEDVDRLQVVVDRVSVRLAHRCRIIVLAI